MDAASWFSGLLDNVLPADPREVEPYGWYGSTFVHGFRKRHHVSIAPSSRAEFYVRVQWCDRGSRDMLRYYGLSVVGGDLTWTLKESQHDCGTVIGDDPEAALAVLSKEEARAVRRADLALGLDETIKYLKPALAKHYADACVEVWRRAELEHSDLEEDFSKKNSELVAAHGRLQKDARAAPSAYARLKAIAEEVCARSDEARSDADRQKEIAIEAVLMLRNVAPGVSLFPDVPASSGLRF